MFIEKQFIFTTSWRLAKLYEKALKTVGHDRKLTQCEMDVLLFVYTNNSMNTSRDIAEQRSISKSLICKSVSALCEKKLLVSVGDGIDARVMRLELTQEGTEIASELLVVADKLCDELFDGISNTELQILSSVYNRMLKSTGRKSRNLY